MRLGCTGLVSDAGTSPPRLVNSFLSALLSFPLALLFSQTHVPLLTYARQRTPPLHRKRHRQPPFTNVCSDRSVQDAAARFYPRLSSHHSGFDSSYYITDPQSLFLNPHRSLLPNPQRSRIPALITPLELLHTSSNLEQNKSFLDFQSRIRAYTGVTTLSSLSRPNYVTLSSARGSRHDIALRKTGRDDEGWRSRIVVELR